MEYTIKLTEAENKALTYVAADPHEWIQNAASERSRIAMEEIFQEEVARMLQDPNIKEIPADREAVVLAAKIQSAAKRNKEIEKQSLEISKE
jgi:predicted nucleic acid-binding protein